MNNVDQANGVHVKDGGSIGIAAHLRGVAGDANQIANTYSRGSEQIGLNAQYVAIPAGVMQDRFNPCLLLEENRQRLVAHASRGARAIGDVNSIYSNRLKKPRAFEFFLDIR